MPPEPTTSFRRNAALFALLCAAIVAGVIGYALRSRGPESKHPAPAPSSNDVSRVAAIRLKPHLLFRNLALGPEYGRLMIVALDAPDGARYATPLSCERVYGAARNGVCLQAMRDVFTTFQCVGFDERFQTTHTFKLAGVPSRARVSRDGQLAGVTVFTAGHGYSQAGFSTRASIFDLQSGADIGDLEQFAVVRDGRPFKEVDFNFWGITFADDHDLFYATLATGGKIFLVEGRLARRELTVLREGVECPSLSPEGTRLVFKSRTIVDGGRLIWRLHVLDLKKQAEVAVNESRSVD